jgi:hypothetical protein
MYMLNGKGSALANGLGDAFWKDFIISTLSRDFSLVMG